MTERLTSQKRIIKDYLTNTKSHPTAEQVYDKVKKQLPSISLATVYRILNDFKNKKIIKQICSTTKHFDADLTVHDHFICNKCDQIIDLNNKHSINQKKHLKKVGLILDQQTAYFGYCEKCL